MADLVAAQAAPIDKAYTSNIENLDEKVGSITAPSLTIQEQKRLFRKIDIHVLIMLCIMYLIQYMDRGNIGNARIQGLATELHLTSTRYSNVLTVFAVAYAVFEIPSNLLLRVFRPRFYLPGLVIIWGTIMLASAFCKSYHSFLGVRFLLGMFEAGFFPGVTFYLTLWYPRKWFGLRLGCFFVSASLAGSFSGLLAYAFAHLSGKSGLLGWSWIFLLEGVITVVVGIVALFLVHDDPASVTFLTEEEKAWLLHELRASRGVAGGHENESITLHDVVKTWADPQTFPLAILALLSTLPVNALSQFLPTIIAGMGYTALKAQLLTIPVFASAVPMIIFVAWISDRREQRIIWLLITNAIAMIGWVMLAAANEHQVAARLTGCFFVGIGIYGGFAAAAALTASNFGGKTKRAVGIATCNGFSGLSGIISANAFRTSQAPRFRPGCYTAIGAVISNSLVLCGLYIYYSTVNKRRAKFLSETDRVYTADELATMGDKAPTYKYSL